MDIKLVAHLCVNWFVKPQWVYQQRFIMDRHHREAAEDDADRIFGLYGHVADLFAINDLALICHADTS